jgi:TRAP-type C4-dicarboxylate transport system substrate-binding protein
MTNVFRAARAGLLTAVGALVLAAPAHAIDEKEFKVVGTWGNLQQWKDHESRLWNKVIPEASGGKLTANAKPYTELGLKGFEVMRLLKVGAYDAVHGLTSYTSQDSPPLEGLDLSGVIQDMDTYQQAAQAYRKIIARELNDKYNAKLLMLYTFPSQQIWCKITDGKAQLTDLKGKKIRAYSTTQSDFIEGLGASAVTLAFAEVVPALQRGVADCGVTGTLPAYNAKWWQVVTHNIRVRLGYAATFLAFNNNSWNALSDDTRKLIEEKAAEVEKDMWEAVKKEDELGMQCNAKGPCPYGDPGGMTPVELNDADKSLLKTIVNDFVVARFAKRCGAACAKEWNATVGKVAGATAPE